MTDAEIQADRERQQQHAEEIRRRRAPEEQQSANLRALVLDIIRQEVPKLVTDAMSKLTIQGGGKIKVSGSGYNITITNEPFSFTGSANCDGEGGIIVTGNIV